MTSFSFPNMLNHTTANIINDKEAVKSNLALLFSSENKSLFGDPYFGCLLQRFFFDTATDIVVDLLVDTLYTAIVTFIPQLVITRKDIKILTSGTSIYAQINCTYAEDRQSDLFIIQLTNPNDIDE